MYMMSLFCTPDSTIRAPFRVPITTACKKCSTGVFSPKCHENPMRDPRIACISRQKNRWSTVDGRRSMVAS